ncbi:response regulator [Streptomyces sp. BA2]|uniref:response regulator n=1 Tax=Streptomyces sp. BA2 TaxID=436595 RepID=UPI0013273A7A|nr:response regulator [Streptomyces sp. BA2]MWA10878.1 response regulator [Streptomyces sp. BA2]
MPTKSAILVVDDHKDTLFALESALAPLGYPLVSATNGDDALRVVLRGDVGLILLDVRMPGVSGLDVVRYVRRLDQTRGIPIVLLTGFDVSREIAAAAFLLGVADVALKPIDPLTLRTKVRYLFDTYEQLKSMQQEIDDLRTQVKDGSITSATVDPAEQHQR